MSRCNERASVKSHRSDWVHYYSWSIWNEWDKHAHNVSTRVPLFVGLSKRRSQVGSALECCIAGNNHCHVTASLVIICLFRLAVYSGGGGRRRQSILLGIVIARLDFTHSQSLVGKCHKWIRSHTPIFALVTVASITVKHMDPSVVHKGKWINVGARATSQLAWEYVRHGTSLTSVIGHLASRN